MKYVLRIKNILTILTSRKSLYILIAGALLFITMPFSYAFERLTRISLPPHHEIKTFQEILLKIQINKQDINQAAILLQDQAKHIYVTSIDLKIWHIANPETLPDFF